LLDKFGGTDAGAAPYKPTMVSPALVDSKGVTVPLIKRSSLFISVRRWREHSGGYAIGAFCSSKL